MSPRLHSFSDLSSLFGEPDASERATKKDAQAEAQARPESRDMLEIAQTERPAKPDYGNGTAPCYAETAPNEVRRIKALLQDRLSRARNLAAGQMLAETIEITPAMAQYILDTHNKRNRPVSQGRIQKLARKIRAGEMLVTSQGISFATDDGLNNGQHRLLACVQTGMPIRVFVVFGETPKAFEVLDTQGSRTGSDTLAVLGYSHTTVLAAAARQLMIVTSDNPLSNASFDNTRVIKLVEAHPELQGACVPGSRVGAKLGCSKAATTVAFYLIARRSKHAVQLDAFVEKLCDPTKDTKGRVILTLRDGLMKKELDSQFRSGGNRAAAQAAAIIKAWNIWVTKSRFITDILWREGESFPQPV